MQPITVSQLNQAIAAILTETIGSIEVIGEISNFTVARSGHRYFTLKDEAAQVSCVMWRGRSLSVRPSDGMQVRVAGDLSVYSPRGQYQIDCHSLQPLGHGELFLAFEALKARLARAGYFDAERKRPLPALPMHVGVVTSATGAAIRDILSTLDRRFPAAEVLLAPTVVQGDRAPEAIAQAIATINHLVDQGQVNCQVLIVGRGGGSLEDLWAFNTLEVAEAIVASDIPVVSAVGHETDFTIADFVADCRAATPTAAAELVSPSTYVDLLRQLERHRQQLDEEIAQVICHKHQQIDLAVDSRAFERLPDRLSQARIRVDDIEHQLTRAIGNTLTRRRQRWETVETRLRALHPLTPLERGFALLEHDGQPLLPSSSLADFNTVDIVRERERATAKITDVRSIHAQTETNSRAPSL